MISEKRTSDIFESLYQLVQTQVDTMGKEPLTSCFAKKKMFGSDANIIRKKRVHFAVCFCSFTCMLFFRVKECMFTRLRLPGVRLLRAPGYNEHFFSLKEDSTPMFEKLRIKYNEYRL